MSFKSKRMIELVDHFSASLTIFKKNIIEFLNRQKSLKIFIALKKMVLKNKKIQRECKYYSTKLLQKVLQLIFMQKESLKIFTRD